MVQTKKSRKAIDADLIPTRLIEQQPKRQRYEYDPIPTLAVIFGAITPAQLESLQQLLLTCRELNQAWQAAWASRYSKWTDFGPFPELDFFPFVSQRFAAIGFMPEESNTSILSLETRVKNNALYLLQHNYHAMLAILLFANREATLLRSFFQELIDECFQCDDAIGLAIVISASQRNWDHLGPSVHFPRPSSPRFPAKCVSYALNVHEALTRVAVDANAILPNDDCVPLRAHFHCSTLTALGVPLIVKHIYGVYTITSIFDDWNLDNNLAWLFRDCRPKDYVKAAQAFVSMLEKEQESIKLEIVRLIPACCIGTFEALTFARNVIRQMSSDTLDNYFCKPSKFNDIAYLDLLNWLRKECGVSFPVKWNLQLIHNDRTLSSEERARAIEMAPKCRLGLLPS